MNRTFRDWLLVIAYLLLIVIVAFESFFISNQFDDAHDDQCNIAEIQALLASVQLQLTSAPEDRAATVKAVNAAIRGLNETCDTHVSEIVD